MKSENKLLLKFSLLIILTFFLFSCGKKEVWNGNILIITLDTTRADHIGSYGYKKGSTPNIDRLANEGVRFEHCYSSIPLTLPSHSNIFTGRFSIGHGVRNNGRYVLNSSERTLAEYLQEEGFNTYAVIASFVLQSKFGLNQGFKVYDDSIDKEDLHKNFKSEIDALEIYNKFDNWFEKNSKSKFFAWVHFYDPHTPYVPHEEQVEKKEKLDLVKFYDGELTYTDKYIGMILDRLEEENVAENTLIVIVGDHGEAFGEHEEFASHMIFCYEANLRVPLIFYNKKLINKSRVISERVDTIDVMPTILDLTGIRKGENIQGESLEYALKGSKQGKDHLIYIESMYGKEELNWAPLNGIINGDYKYISLPKPELYNIKNDPLEKDNLYRKKGPLMREMDEKLKKTILKYSGKGDSKRDLGKEDLEHLRSLGYISSFSGKGNKVVDPKDGMILNVKLKKISSKIKEGALDEIEKELLDIKSTEIGKDNFLVYNFLYKVYMKKRQLSNMMNILEEAIEKLPNSTPFRLNYITRLSELKRYNDVITNCNELIKENPLFTRAFIILGETYGILGENDKAYENYKKALELEPTNIPLQIKYSEKLLKEQQYQEVLSIYNTLLRFEDVKKNIDLLYKIALFNTKYGSMEKSGELFAEIIRKKPEGKYFYYYAMVIAKLGDKVKALNNMQIALSRYSGDLTDEQIATATKAVEAWE